MNRQCADCHRFEATKAQMVASGGWCSPSDTIQNWNRAEKWYCDDCRAKYPEPVPYVKRCNECDGSGLVVISHDCGGCDHYCAKDTECESCLGSGEYQTHDCNPGCDHRFGLPLIKVQRGGIKFS